jgi:hypothetical protein
MTGNPGQRVALLPYRHLPSLHLPLQGRKSNQLRPTIANTRIDETNANRWVDSKETLEKALAA